MLRIRLSRTGKTRQESFRIVVAPHTNAVKGKYIELLGHYKPATQPKQFDIVKERVEYWLKQGAKPSESMATLLKKHGFGDMDQFIAPRKQLSRPKKKDAGKEGGTPAAKAEKKEAAAPKAEVKESSKETAPAEAPSA